MFLVEAAELLEQSQAAAAFDLCRRGLELYPEYATAYLVAARAAVQLRDFNSAITILADGTRRFPQNRSLAQLAEDLGRIDNMTSPVATDVFPDQEKPVLLTDETETAEAQAGPGRDGDSVAEPAAEPEVLNLDDKAEENAEVVKSSAEPQNAEKTEDVESTEGPENLALEDEADTRASVDESSAQPQVLDLAAEAEGNAEVVNPSIEQEIPDHVGEAEAGSESAETPQTADSVDEPQEVRELITEPETIDVVDETEENADPVEPTGDLEARDVGDEAEAPQSRESDDQKAARTDDKSDDKKEEAPGEPARSAGPSSHLRIIETAPNDRPTGSAWRSRNIRLIPGLEFTPLRFESHAGRTFDRSVSMPEPPAFPNISTPPEVPPPGQGESRSDETPLDTPGRRVDESQARDNLKEFARQMRELNSALPRDVFSGNKPPQPALPRMGEIPVSETLANLYVGQKAWSEAIHAFEVLAQYYPERAAEFKARIAELRAKSK